MYPLITTFKIAHPSNNQILGCIEVGQKNLSIKPGPVYKSRFTPRSNILYPNGYRFGFPPAAFDVILRPAIKK